MSHCAKIVFLQNCLDVKNEVFEKKLHFFLSFLAGDRGTEKNKKDKMEKGKKNIKIVFFKVVIQNGKMNKMDF